MTLRVCRITDNSPPPWSGVSPGVYELTAAQASTGLEVEVITKWRKNCLEVDRGAPFPVHSVRGRIIFFEIMALVKLIRLHRKRRLTLFILTAAVFLTSILKPYMKRRRNKVAFCGALIGTKNEADLLKAFSIIRKFDQTVNLIIIGDGY